MQQPTLETARLRIREMQLTDVDGVYALDSNPNVHRYLGNNPISSIEKAEQYIVSVRKQYEEFGIGRWAVIEKESGEFIGWTGFKLNTEPLFGHHHFLDIGYRLREEFWGKGYAHESAVACMNYAVEHLDFEIINAMAMTNNEASVKILNEKLGMRELGIFEGHGAPCYFFEITKAEWLARMYNK
ncbi:MAG: GNAT family N-acetyltransferase [Flavobacteriaceae bacterium]|nr:GNAT family N-acetyltransferase [Flavobacteriaceae bacterium]